MVETLQTKIDSLTNVEDAFADTLQTNTYLFLQMGNILHSVKNTSRQTSKIVEAIKNSNESDNHQTDISSFLVLSNSLSHSSQYQKNILLNVQSLLSLNNIA